MVRMAMGVGLWNSAAGAYLLPRATATATQPGGAGTATSPAAFFNVAFRTAEPFPSETAGTAVVTNPAWWRDQQQGAALAQGNISQFYANVRVRQPARHRDVDRRNMGPLAYASLTETWGPAAPAAASDTLDITATNVAAAPIDPSRAHVDCNAKLNVTSDGPITITLVGCDRAVQAGEGPRKKYDGDPEGSPSLIPTTRPRPGWARPPEIDSKAQTRGRTESCGDAPPPQGPRNQRLLRYCESPPGA